MRRIALPVLLFLAWAPAAHAWSWPLQGPVLQPFAYDEAHPYAAGAHRGIDVGAGAAGDTVLAPTAGTVSFAGTVPTSGKSVTIETADGYSVTLTHLGSILVTRGGTIDEGDAVGTVGPSGTPELDVPYVHLGIRLADDPNGYVDPLSLLPAPAAASSPPEIDSTAPPQPAASGGGASAPAPAAPAPAPVSAPAPVAEPAPPAATTPSTARGNTRGSTVLSNPTHHATRSRADTSRPRAEQPRSTARPAVHAPVATAAPRQSAEPRERSSAPKRPSPRSRYGQTAARRDSTVLDLDREIGPVAETGKPTLRARQSPSVLPELAFNSALALVALAAAIAAGRRSRRGVRVSPVAGAAVVRFPRQASHRFERRAA